MGAGEKNGLTPESGEASLSPEQSQGAAGPVTWGSGASVLLSVTSASWLDDDLETPPSSAVLPFTTHVHASVCLSVTRGQIGSGLNVSEFTVVSPNSHFRQSRLVPPMAARDPGRL